MTARGDSGARQGQLGLFDDETAAPRAEIGSPSREVEPAPVSEELRRLAHALPPSIRLGTSSWSFPGWAGIVYARKHGQSTLAKKGLAAYAQHPLLRAAGIDRTYYAPIGPEEFADYAEAVPPSFRFLVKAHEAVTLRRYPSHRRYGDKRGQLNDLFFDAAYASDRVVGPVVEGLGERAGPIVFQLPPQRLADLGGPEGFPELVHAFLSALPKGPRYAVEIRNEQLLTEGYAEALADVGASHCVNVHPKMPSVETQWAAAGGAGRAPGLVVRWMLPAGLTYEGAKLAFEPFDRLVEEDLDAREGIARLVARTHELGETAIVVINNKAEGSAPLSVARLAEAIDIRLRS